MGIIAAKENINTFKQVLNDLNILGKILFLLPLLGILILWFLVDLLFSKDKRY